jgi:hypothetical protein
MFLGRLANPAIATKCKQDSLDADEVQENRTMSTGSSFNPQHEISDRVRSKFFIDGEWKAPSGSAKLALISPYTEELFLRVPEAYPELQG